MHFLGLSGMPRRIPDYNEAFWTFNWIATIGSFISLISMFYFLYIIFDMLYTKVKRVLRTEDQDNIMWTYYSYIGTTYHFINSLGVEEY